MLKKSNIYWFEPVFYLFFGLFHIHRIWGLIDRKSYADYWLSLLAEKNVMYYVLMITLLILCISGIVVFVKNIGKNYWWRWVYIFGGGYVLFDVMAVLLGIRWWNDLLLFMYNINSPFWNTIWGGFVLIGILSLSLGVYLLYLHRQRA